MSDDDFFYFKPEINYQGRIPKPSLLNENDRKIGENHAIICEYIRKDLIEEFIIYINKESYSLNAQIERSIYDTNRILSKTNPSLIEYSAFYGSIQIFKYLFFHKVKFDDSIWLYAIHSDNEELIHFLEDRQIKPQDRTYEECLMESIKCHNKDVTNYLLNNYIDNSRLKFNINYNFRNNLINYALKYYNYLFVPDKLVSSFAFFYFCKYDYLFLVSFFVKSKKFDVNEKLVFFKCLFGRFLCFSLVMIMFYNACLNEILF